MKTIITAILLATSALTASAEGKFKLSDFAIQLEQVTSSPSHVWVSSGYTTVNPTYPTLTGVGEMFSPPFAARGFALNVGFFADSQPLPDDGSYGKGDVGILYSGGTWLPHKIVRHGTYHHFKDEKLISLAFTTELIPLIGQSGFIEKISVKNRSNTPIEVKALPKLTPGSPDVIPLNEWEFSPPQSKASEAQLTEASTWTNGTVQMRLYLQNPSHELAPGETATSVVTVIMDKAGTMLPETIDAQQLEATAIEAWQKRLDTYTANIPTLTSNVKGMDDYYKRSLISALVCVWENPAFALNPFITTSGIDGGGLCTYLWDNAGYAPNAYSMMFGDQMIKVAKQMASIDLDKYYAYSLDGSGIGVRYAYSPFAFTTLVNSIFKFVKPDKELFDYDKKLIMNDEKRKSSNGLIDYGFQHNLLEMRGIGWEHQVVSPNAERAWCLNRLADMGKILGEPTAETASWNTQADDVIKAVRTNLWDNSKQWFASLYPNGYKDYVHSIQIFDALRSGACTPEMAKVLIAELRDGAYLGRYGVSSISKADSTHFEVVDTDWSGGGAFTGDGPQVAMTMYEKGYPDKGWDVMKRLFWMGENFIYYPQEHFIDRPMSPTGKRANNASGLCGVESVLFGLLGFQPGYDGSLSVNPQVIEGNLQIHDFVFKGKHFNVDANATHLTVKRDGTVVYDGAPKQVRIL